MKYYLEVEAKISHTDDTFVSCTFRVLLKDTQYAELQRDLCDGVANHEVSKKWFGEYLKPYEVEPPEVHSDCMCNKCGIGERTAVYEVKYSCYNFKIIWPKIAG